jgi:hypothetical protein
MMDIHPHPTQDATSLPHCNDGSSQLIAGNKEADSIKTQLECFTRRKLGKSRGLEPTPPASGTKSSCSQGSTEAEAAIKGVFPVVRWNQESGRWVCRNEEGKIVN